MYSPLDSLSISPNKSFKVDILPSFYSGINKVENYKKIKKKMKNRNKKRNTNQRGTKL